MIGNIELRNLLPLVFSGREEVHSIGKSQIWEMPSVVFERGCKICIQAESGSGKSSLLSFIFGNRDDYKGEILFDSVNIRTFDIKKWSDMRTSQIALLPQEMRLFPELTVMQNIAIKNRRTGVKTEKEIRQLLEKLGIAEKENALVGKLSIGQQQRVALIRTLCQPFDFIFLDEPVSHLDKTNNKIVAQLVEEEAGKQGAGVISTSVGNNLLLEDAQYISM